jgi:hypothetical protein
MMTQKDAVEKRIAEQAKERAKLVETKLALEQQVKEMTRL